MGASIANMKFGLEDLSRNIQTVNGFMSSNLNISVGQYLLIFTLTKILAFFIIAAATILLCLMLCSNTDILSCFFRGAVHCCFGSFGGNYSHISLLAKHRRKCFDKFGIFNHSACNKCIVRTGFRALCLYTASWKQRGALRWNCKHNCGSDYFDGVVYGGLEKVYKE